MALIFSSQLPMHAVSGIRQLLSFERGYQHAAVLKHQEVTKDPQQNACLCQSLKADL